MSAMDIRYPRQAFMASANSLKKGCFWCRFLKKNYRKNTVDLDKFL
jgi:hypothetical protein